MKTVSAKFERAKECIRLESGWAIWRDSPMMTHPENFDCGLLPSDVVVYRNRRAVVVSVSGSDVFLDRPLVMSHDQYNAKPSVYVFREIAKL